MKLLKNLFGKSIPTTHPHAQALAVAQLLLEIARADSNVSAAELHAIRRHLAEAYALADSELDALLVQARTHVEQAISLDGALAAVNRTLQPPDKARLMRTLWQVAYADGALDPHEETLLRRLADLLYVSHSVFIREKLARDHEK